MTMVINNYIYFYGYGDQYPVLRRLRWWTCSWMNTIITNLQTLMATIITNLQLDGYGDH